MIRVLNEIALNSVHHNSFDNNLEIQIVISEPSPRILEISIEDNGKGVIETELKHLEQLFYSSKKSDEHLGIGLTYVHETLKIINGSMKFTRLKQGLKTTITWPLNK